MWCEERIRLAKEYAEASALYAKATRTRNADSIGDAKANCVNAREAMRKHKKEHGCGMEKSFSQTV